MPCGCSNRCGYTEVAADRPLPLARAVRQARRSAASRGPQRREGSIQCPRCQGENKAGWKFCAVCGQAPPLSCARCGFVNDPRDQFCGDKRFILEKTEGNPFFMEEMVQALVEQGILVGDAVVGAKLASPSEGRASPTPPTYSARSASGPDRSSAGSREEIAADSGRDWQRVSLGAAPAGGSACGRGVLYCFQ